MIDIKNIKQLTEVQLLELLTKNNGDCSQVAGDYNINGIGRVCDVCPFSKLKKHKNGSYMSCSEALNMEDLTVKQQDKIIEREATRMLKQLAVDEILGDKCP